MVARAGAEKGADILFDTSFAERVLARGRDVVATEEQGLGALRAALGDALVEAAKALLTLKGRVIISGLGKSGHIGSKIAATLASTGTPASFVHAAEAAHGDMGMISGDDLVMLISNSGETAELGPIIQHMETRGGCVIAFPPSRIQR